jgi:hypothetical protein
MYGHKYYDIIFFGDFAYNLLYNAVPDFLSCVGCRLDYIGSVPEVHLQGIMIRCNLKSTVITNNMAPKYSILAWSYA